MDFLIDELFNSQKYADMYKEDVMIVDRIACSQTTTLDTINATSTKDLYFGSMAMFLNKDFAEMFIKVSQTLAIFDDAIGKNEYC